MSDQRDSRTAKRTAKPSVHYARTDEGVDLPVIDVTHPAFLLDVTDDEQRQLVAKFLGEPQPFAGMPAFVRNALYRFFLRKSVLARGIRQASGGGGYLAAMSTYLLKLGPDNLAADFASPIDRRIAASLPALAVRLRLQDVARMLADALQPLVAASAGSPHQPHQPLRLLNIAGGTAIDSINALLLLRQDHALTGRRIRIDVLDVDSTGPAFGARALEALRRSGGPLEGVDVALAHTRYDWNDASALRAVLENGDAVSAASSEGGLFEYGTDEAILANLAYLREGTARDFVLVGSVTRADEPVERLHRSSHAATRPRGLDAFRALAERAGWRVARAVERPFSDQVTLVPRE
jgi:hypothetical protein